jgi:GABA(A) receptor-associated protein
MIPLILEKDPRSKIEPLEKKKYLSSSKYTLFHFLETTKKMFATKIKKSESLCFYIAGRVIENGGKQIVNAEKLMEDVYRAHRDEDGFLYVIYGTLEAF